MSRRTERGFPEPPPVPRLAASERLRHVLATIDVRAAQCRDAKLAAIRSEILYAALNAAERSCPPWPALVDWNMSIPLLRRIEKDENGPATACIHKQIGRQRVSAVAAQPGRPLSRRRLS